MQPKPTPAQIAQIARRKAYDKLVAKLEIKPHPFCTPIATGPLKVRFGSGAMATI